MSNQDNMPWWKMLGFIAGGAAVGYLGYKGTEAIVDTLIESSDAEAFKKIAALAAKSNPEYWQLFRSVLESRTTTSRRANDLLSFADQMRSLAEHVDQLLVATPEHIVQTYVASIPNLDEVTWFRYEHILTIKAESNEQATILLSIAQRIRRDSDEIDQLLQLDPAQANQLLEGMVYGMNQNEQDLFINVLRSRTQAQPNVRSRALLGNVQRLLGA